MTHRACRPRTRTGHLTAAGPVTPTRSRDRWGRAETERTALGEALVMRRRTRGRFPPPPPRGSPRKHGFVSPNPVLRENPQLSHVGPGRTTGPYVGLRLSVGLATFSACPVAARAGPLDALPDRGSPPPRAGAVAPGGSAFLEHPDGVGAYAVVLHGGRGRVRLQELLEVLDGGSLEDQTD